MDSIPESAFPTLFKYSQEVYEEKVSQTEAKKIIFETTGVKKNSSHYYIYAYKGLMTGTEFKGNISAPSFDYFLDQIHQLFGQDQLLNALKAFNLHLEYYKNTGKGKKPKPLKKLRSVYHKFQGKLNVKQPITSISGIINNIKTFENYLTSDNAEEAVFASDLLTKGIDFLCYKNDDEIRFVPSKFIGYDYNSLESYSEGDGRVTTKILNQIIGVEPKSNQEIELLYQNFLKQLGVSLKKAGTAGNGRKFWSDKFEYPSNSKVGKGYWEGNLVERKHLARERDSKLIKDARDRFKKQHGSLFCEACKFKFEETYGILGEGFIECHHTVPVAKMPPGYQTKIEEIAMVCSNCHRMLHKSKNLLTVDELKAVMGKANKHKIANSKAVSLEF